MTKDKKKARRCRAGRKVADYFLCSLVIVSIVFLFTLIPLSFSLFNTAQTMREQYSLMDAYYSIYNAVGDSRPSLKLSNDIVIVDIKSVYGRRELADVLEAVAAAGPKAVGLDVTFFERKDSLADERIADFASAPNVVSPCILTHENPAGSGIFGDMESSFYGPAIAPGNMGFVNVDLVGATLSCRHFVPYMYVGERCIPNFAVALSDIASAESYKALMARKRDREYINFDRTAFLSVDAEAIYENLDLLSGKIVLVGDKEDLADQYVTPMDSRQPGVEIHAHAVDTVINGKFVDVMSEAGTWLLTFFVILLFLPFADFIGKNEWALIFMPVIQTLLMLLAVFLGYCIFVNCHYYIKVIYIILGIGFMGTGKGLYLKLKRLPAGKFSKPSKTKES